MSGTVDMRALYDLADALDATGFASHFAPSGTMRFGDGPVATGPEEISQALAGFFGAISSMSHRFLQEIRDSDTVALETVVTYGRQDGKLVEVPASAWYTLSPEGISAGRVYSDMAKVFEP